MNDPVTRSPSKREAPAAVRRAGVLLHPSSLPGPYGIGSLGSEARSFVDWLASAGVTLWQILPLVPPGPAGSPYASPSAFAGDRRLLDPRELVPLGLLEPGEIDAAEVEAGPIPDAGRVAGTYVSRLKTPLLERAADRLLCPQHREHAAFRAFLEAAPWVGEAAHFQALRRRYRNAPWWTWPVPLRDRQPMALAALADHAFEREQAILYLFDRQWRALHEYAGERGVLLVGDVPLYVSHDSDLVWSAPHLFDLDPTGQPIHVAGVPPDAFSETGQRWGNPIYRWDRLREDDYHLFVARVARALELTDFVRIDHFRGLAAYWEIDADAEDARAGRWALGPGRALLDALRARLGSPLPLVAEDLGLIDDPVRGLLRDGQLPGMKVLQFAFGGGADNPYLPHRHRPDSVVYTGTHDNDTTRGWWDAAPDEVKAHARAYLHRSGHEIEWDLIRTAFASVAGWAIVPAQDLLGLGAEARLNTPSVCDDGNWTWRMQAGALDERLAEKVRALVERYERYPRR